LNFLFSVERKKSARFLLMDKMALRVGSCVYQSIKMSIREFEDGRPSIKQKNLPAGGYTLA
jgi:hypothetical protein